MLEKTKKRNMTPDSSASIEYHNRCKRFGYKFPRTKNTSRKIRKNRRVENKREISRSMTLKLIDFKTRSKVSYYVSLLAAWYLSKIKVASYPQGVMRHRAGMPGILIATRPSNRVWLSDISVHQRIAVSWAWIRRTFPYVSGIPPITPISRAPKI